MNCSPPPGDVTLDAPCLAAEAPPLSSSSGVPSVLRLVSYKFFGPERPYIPAYPASVKDSLYYRCFGEAASYDATPLPALKKLQQKRLHKRKGKAPIAPYCAHPGEINAIDYTPNRPRVEGKFYTQLMVAVNTGKPFQPGCKQPVCPY